MYNELVTVTLIFLGSILRKNLSNLVFLAITLENSNDKIFRKNYSQNLRLLMKQIWAVKFVATFSQRFGR